MDTKHAYKTLFGELVNLYQDSCERDVYNNSFESLHLGSNHYKLPEGFERCINEQLKHFRQMAFDKLAWGRHLGSESWPTVGRRKL
jgi:hypothetical protein